MKEGSSLSFCLRIWTICRFSKNQGLSGENSILPHAWWARIVMAASIAFIVYWTAKPAVTHTVMAKQGEVLDQKRYQNSLCAPSFKREIEGLGNRGCLPAKCGRVVFDGLVRDEEVHGLISLAKRGLAKGGSSGGASILDLHSGALSKGEQFVNIYALYPDLFAEADFEVYRRVKDRVKAAVVEHFGLQSDSLFLSHPTFFSRITADPAKTMHDEVCKSPLFSLRLRDPRAYYFFASTGTCTSTRRPTAVSTSHRSYTSLTTESISRVAHSSSSTTMTNLTGTISPNNPMNSYLDRL